MRTVILPPTGLLRALVSSLRRVFCQLEEGGGFRSWVREMRLVVRALMPGPLRSGAVAKGVLLSASILSCAGCAGISFTTLEEEDDKRARGFRHYDSSLFMLVQTDNQGGLTSTVISMPDTTKLRQVKPYKFLAKNNANFAFTNGVLTEGNNTGDGTAVPNAFISALEGAVNAGLKAGVLDLPEGGESKKVPQVYLLKIEKINGVWTLVGAEGSPLNF